LISAKEQQEPSFLSLLETKRHEEGHITALKKALNILTSAKLQTILKRIFLSSSENWFSGIHYLNLISI
jgi:hypothetical protein